MSNLARDFARAKLSKLPPLPPEPTSPSHDQATEDLDGDSSSASSMSSTGTARPSSSQKSTKPESSSSFPPWTDFFDQELYLEKVIPEAHAKYHVYLCPPVGSKAPLLVLHHGAGSSGMSFALFAREVRKQMPEVGILSFEAREHGSTIRTSSSSDSGFGEVVTDFSLSHLADDLSNAITLTREKLSWPSLPQILLVGHSLGGAVVTDVAHRGLLGTNLLGYAVLDVVEGSAMEALKFMQSYLSTRPARFRTLDEAVEWHVRSRTLRNPASARASVPTLFVHEGPKGEGNSESFVWKTDIRLTEPYWSDWFANMSEKFLSSREAKLLLLAGTDRLDKPLMIGQMQGKFQLQVFPNAGHFLQEDQPEEVARTVVEFLRRNDRSALVLPPKVGDLLKQGKKV